MFVVRLQTHLSDLTEIFDLKGGRMAEYLLLSLFSLSLLSFVIVAFFYYCKLSRLLPFFLYYHYFLSILLPFLIFVGFKMLNSKN